MENTELFEAEAPEAVVAAEPVAEAASEQTDAQVRAILEAIIYITDEPLTMEQMAAALGQSRASAWPALLAELTAEFAQPGAWPRHTGNRRRLQDGDQGRASRSGARFREEPEAAR